MRIRALWIMLVGLLPLVFLVEPAFCVTYYVPDDFPTIQAAVDATWGGETIIVRAGTYTGEGNKNITINKIITVRSESGPENTIIDCEGAGRGFSFVNVSNLTVLDGFTIINGSVTGTTTTGNGGGIYCSSASPRISNCIISGNRASYYGGGIYGTGSSFTLTNCSIINNGASGSGGGIYATGGTSSLSNCSITGNIAGTSGHGGGIYSGALSITNSTIIDNSAGGDGGGIYSGTVSITNSSIIDNSSSNGDGGGIRINGTTSSSITNCAIVSNRASNGEGGGIYASNATFLTTNCTFAWNSARAGGGIYFTNTSNSYVCTIRNSIFYFDSALQEIYRASGTLSITYSNILGGYAGEGNIDENPEFAANGDYHLSALSPCIDTATPENAPDSDLDGELRPAGEGYDMGADEFDGIPAPPPPTPSRADLNNDGVVDGLDAALFAQEFGRIDVE